MREVALLVKHGWPPELAMSMDDHYRIGLWVICQELEGTHKFDWDKMAFVERQAQG